MGCKAAYKIDPSKHVSQLGVLPVVRPQPHPPARNRRKYLRKVEKLEKNKDQGMAPPLPGALQGEEGDPREEGHQPRHQREYLRV